ncbi:MAG: M12 family metallopeptidase [Pseudonocardia sp.]
MSRTDDRYHDALAQIAEIARAACAAPAAQSVPARNGTAVADFGCVVKRLPARLAARAARHAIETFPLNAPSAAVLAGANAGPVPLAIAVDTQRWWGPTPRQFTVSFLESTPADLRARIVSHLNAWSARCGMSFVETGGVGEVRISRGPGGYYSYLGTDIGLVDLGEQTMNLEGFTMGTPESEYRRVVRHEAGHTLGFPHEHMRADLVARIDPELAYPYFWQTQGWDQAMVDAQVLTPLDEASLYGTPVDQDSIMCYQLPGSITYDGQPIRGGLDIDSWDYDFAASLYPPVGYSPVATRARVEDAVPA